jgi:ureidoglycolate hydrolase
MINKMNKITIKEIKVKKLSKESFSRFGEVIGMQDSNPFISNNVIKFWPCESLADVGNGVSQFAWLEVKADQGLKNEFYCESLDRHLTSSEANIPINGESIIIVALQEKIDDTNSSVNINSIEAFIVNENRAINIKRGVWHSRPFAISGLATFVVIFEKEVHKKDMITVNLKDNINVLLKVLI